MHCIALCRGTTVPLARRKSDVPRQTLGLVEQTNSKPLSLPLNQCSGHPSRCFTPKHHSLLQPPRLHQATQPLPSRGPPCGRHGYVTPAFSGVPNTGTKNGKKGGQRGEIEGNLARHARRASVLSLPPPPRLSRYGLTDAPQKVVPVQWPHASAVLCRMALTAVVDCTEAQG